MSSKLKKKIVLGLLMLALAVVAAGCGKQNSKEAIEEYLRISAEQGEILLDNVNIYMNRFERDGFYMDSALYERFEIARKESKDAAEVLFSLTPPDILKEDHKAWMEEVKKIDKLHEDALIAFTDEDPEDFMNCLNRALEYNAAFVEYGNKVLSYSGGTN